MNATIAFGLAHTVGRCRAFHAIIALGWQTWSNDVGRGMPSSLLNGQHGRTTSGGIPSSHLGSTHGRTTSSVACHHPLWTSSHSRTALGVACHHCPLTDNAAERRQAWHAIIALGQHTRSNDVRRGITSPPFDSTHSRTTSGVACHHRLWAAHKVERRQAWHAIIALGRQTRSNDVRRGMPSSPLD